MPAPVTFAAANTVSPWVSLECSLAHHCGTHGRSGSCSRPDTHHAITINTPLGDAFPCPERCMSDIVVEGNTVVLTEGNGTCASNWLFVAALHSVASGNDCTVEETTP